MCSHANCLLMHIGMHVRMNVPELIRGIQCRAEYSCYFSRLFAARFHCRIAFRETFGQYCFLRRIQEIFVRPSLARSALNSRLTCLTIIALNY